MGQYYRPVLRYAESRRSTIYNRKVDGQYTMAKLMEHSWWHNEFVSTLCKKLYKNPMRVVWVGDYSDDADETNGLTKEDLKELRKIAWYRKGREVEKDELLLDGKFLVNHTKGCYIDCSEYRNACERDGWCIHPLPLLTAVGNGLGGGDYMRGTNVEDVGRWANDIISVEDVEPGEDYSKEQFEFIEE